jgi:acyl carrier protein
VAGDDVAAIILNLARQFSGAHDLRSGDNFFEHGGDSLGAVELTVECERVLHLTIPVDTIFDCTSIDAFAHRVQGLLDSDRNSAP